MPAHSRRRGRPHYFIRRVAAVILAVIVVVVALVGVSLIGALRTPGNQSFEAKWADWLRGHHMATLANDIETYYYQHHVPRRGRPARPPQRRPHPGRSTTPVERTIVVVPHLRAPAPVPLVVSPHLPGEGLVASRRRAGATASRPCTSPSSGPTPSTPARSPRRCGSIRRLLRMALVPGAQEPGGTWPAAPGHHRAPPCPTAVAAFNGGFRLQDAHGGFYLDGRQAVPLRRRGGLVGHLRQRAGRYRAPGASEVTMTPRGHGGPAEPGPHRRRRPDRPRRHLQRHPACGAPPWGPTRWWPAPASASPPPGPWSTWPDRP